MLELLADLGADVEWTGANEVRVDAAGDRARPSSTRSCAAGSAPRSCSPGPLLARFGRATVPPPGGDVIGRRRLDPHIHAFAELGAEIEIDGALRDARDRGCAASPIFLDEASVMATENAVMAAVLAEGETVIGNAACEPHVQDLCRFLVSLGAQIEGIGSNVLRIEGVERARRRRATASARSTSRSASFIGLAAVTGGDLTIEDVEPRGPDLDPAGVRAARRRVEVGGRDRARAARPGARGPGRPRRPDPEDRGRPVARVPGRPHVDRRRRRHAGARARSSIFEKMFESRLFFVDKLVVDGRADHPLRPAPRGRHRPGAALRRADGEPGHPRRHGDADRGLCAEGTSTIGNIAQIDRGYERIDERLRALGARIERVDA